MVRRLSSNWKSGVLPGNTTEGTEASSQLVLSHRLADLLQSQGRKDIGSRVGIPAVSHAEPPELSGTRGPFDQQMRVLGVDLHRKLPEMERPDLARWLSALYGQ